MQTTSERPRFRQDLVAEPIEDGGARFIDVMDPDSGTLYRFFEIEFSLACAMDGQRDVAGIVKWAEEELGVKPSQKEIRSVISTLGELGYLEGGAAAAAAASAAAAAASAPAATPTKAPTPPVGIKKQPEQPAVNRWDAPTAMGDSDDYLERGVVTGQKRPHTPVPDVELGQAGTRNDRRDDMPRAPNLELGQPGTRAPAAAKPGADIPLGPSGAGPSDSVDLSADMPVSSAALKEAVKQSQVMKAAEAPPELAEAKPAPRAEAKPAPRTEARPEPKPEPRPEPRAEARPQPKPEPRPEPRRPAQDTRPPAPSRGVSPVLIAALVLAILGAGGFALWKFVLSKKDSTAQSKVEPQPQPQPQPPPAPPVETAKLAVEQPTAEEVKPVAPGTIAMIVASDTAVKEGDPIARLDGFKPVETQIAATEKAITKAKEALVAADKEIEATTTAGNKNGLALAEKKKRTAQTQLTDNETKLATQKAALDKFLIKSPGAGKITAVAKAKAKVAPTDVIATLTRDAALVATFKSAGEVTQGARVLLALKETDQKLSCTVAQAGGDGVKVACPKDAAPEGAEVTFAGLDPNAPPPGEMKPEEPKPTEQKPEEPKPTETKPEEPKPEEAKPEEKKAPTPRPRPRPRPRPPAGSGEGSAAPPAEPPAEKPAEPAPAPTP